MEWWEGGDLLDFSSEKVSGEEAAQQQSQISNTSNTSNNTKANLHDLAILAALPNETLTSSPNPPSRKRKLVCGDYVSPVDHLHNINNNTKVPMTLSEKPAAEAARSLCTSPGRLSTSLLHQYRYLGFHLPTLSGACKQWNDALFEQTKAQKLVLEAQSDLEKYMLALESAKLRLTQTQENIKKISVEGWQELITDDVKWYEAYLLLKAYNSNRNSNTAFSTRSSTPSPNAMPAKLSRWAGMNRKKYRQGSLEDYKIMALNALNFDWDPSTTNWMAKYALLKEFYQKHGHARVQYHTNSSNKNTEDIANTNTLGKWVKRQQYQYKLIQEGKASELTHERILLLEKIGMIWSRRSESWKLRYQELVNFRQVHDHVHVTLKLDPSLFEWVRDQRAQLKKYLVNPNQSTLDKNQVSLLQSIGCGETDLRDSKFQTRLEEMVQFKKTHRHTSIPRKYPYNQALSNWWATQRRQYTLMKRGQKSQLTPERAQQLFHSGLDLDCQKKQKFENSWDESYAELQLYKEEKGSLPAFTSGSALGKWCQLQRDRISLSKPPPSLTIEQIEKLNEIGFDWGKAGPPLLEPVIAATSESLKKDKNWEELFGQLLEHRILTNSFDITMSSPDEIKNKEQLQEFVQQLCGDYAYFQKDLPCRYLTKARMEQLEAVGFPFPTMAQKKATKTWEEMYLELLQYRLNHGNFSISSSENQDLYQWSKDQRTSFRKFQKQPTCMKSSIVKQRFGKLKAIHFPILETDDEEDDVSDVEHSPLPVMEKPSPIAIDTPLVEEPNLQYGPLFPLDLAPLTASTRSDIAWPPTSQGSPRYPAPSTLFPASQYSTTFDAYASTIGSKNL